MNLNERHRHPSMNTCAGPLEMIDVSYIETTLGRFFLKLGAKICDASVRIMQKGIDSHSGFNFCRRCVQHGEYCNQGCGIGDGGVACFQLESESGVGVGFLKLLELELRVGFSKLLESESVFQNCWSRSRESKHLLQLPTPMFIK